MPSQFLSKHSPSDSGVGLYVLFETKVTCPSSTVDANSLVLVTYLHTFLLYPIQTETRAAAASLLMTASSATVGAPGFSR